MNQRICFVIPSLELGGSERSLIKLSRVLAESGGQIAIVTFTTPGARSLLSEVHKDVQIVPIGDMRSANPYLWFRIWRFLRQWQPNVVFGWSTYANLIVALVSSGRRKSRLILSERNYLPKLLHGSDFSARVRRRIVLEAAKRLYGKADVITANSKTNLKFIRRFFKGSFETSYIPNFVDLRVIDELSAEKAEGVPDTNGIRLLAVARLERAKGIDVLLRAFSEVRDSVNADLCIVGAGSLMASLQDLASELGVQDRTYWLGRRSNPFPYYRWADIVIMPSRHEGFPNVALEAMASSKPVICTDCKTGPRELTQNGRYGCLVPVDDSRQIAQEIRRLANDESERDRLGKSAGRRVADSFDAKVVTDYIVGLLQS